MCLLYPAGAVPEARWIRDGVCISTGDVCSRPAQLQPGSVKGWTLVSQSVTLLSEGKTACPLLRSNRPNVAAKQRRPWPGSEVRGRQLFFPRAGRRSSQEPNRRREVQKYTPAGRLAQGAGSAIHVARRPRKSHSKAWPCTLTSCRGEGGPTQSVSFSLHFLPS